MLLDLGATTPPKRLLAMVAKAQSLYAAWRKNPRKGSRIVHFLARGLDSGHSDVVHEFLKAAVQERDELTVKLIRELTQTPEWLRFASTRARAKKAPVSIGQRVKGKREVGHALAA